MKKAVLQKPSSDPNGTRPLFVPNIVRGTFAQDREEVLSQGTSSGGAEKPILKNLAE